METEPSIVVTCAATEANSNNNGNTSCSTSSNNNNNNIVIKNNCNSQTSNTTNCEIVIEERELKSTGGSNEVATNDKSTENCDNGDSGVAVAFAEIHLNNNKSSIGFVDDEDEAVGETIRTIGATDADEGACYKPDASNCGFDAVVEDGKHFAQTGFSSRPQADR